MPTYEYACKSCGNHTEAVQSFTDDPLTVCPTCGGPLRKVFGNIGISFKGSGFYKNDSRNSTSSAKPVNGTGAKSSEGSSSESGSGSSGGDGAKSDTKSGSDSTGSGTSGSEKSSGAKSGDKPSGDKSSSTKTSPSSSSS